MNNTYAFGIIGLLAGFILGAYTGPSMLQRYPMMGRTLHDEHHEGDANTMIDMMGGMMGSNGMMGDIDEHFIEAMIPHHEGAIAMAKLALEKGQHAEIKSLAAAIIDAQTKEINQMKTWYAQWFGAEPSETSMTSMMDMMGENGMMTSMRGDLNTLEDAKDFDQEFIRQMVPHHEMAVMMAGMLAATTKRPEMKELANNIITSQTREIEMMKSWSAVWK